MKRLMVAVASWVLAIPAHAQEDPGLELLYRAKVKLGEVIEVGETARGNRRIIPIAGGTFEGPEIRGEIMPMGWDWQLDRADGCTDVVADYFLRTDDGVVINVLNTGALCRSDQGNVPPSRTNPVFEPPLGKYEWLGKGGYVGTIGFDPLVQEAHVIITIYRAN